MKKNTAYRRHTHPAALPFWEGANVSVGSC